MESVETSASEGTTQSTEMTTIDDASMEDLESFIANDKSLEVGESESEESESTPEPEDKQPAERSDKKEDKKDDSKELAAKLSALEEENAKLKAHNKNVELWNNRQSTEIGELRKQLKEAIQKKSEGLQEKFLEDPVAASKQLDAIKQHEQELQALDSQEAVLQHIQRTYQVVTQHIPENELNVEAMAKSLEADGLDKSFIQTFMQNPYAQAHGETIIQLNKRAVAESRLQEAVGVIQQLVAENEKLKKRTGSVLSNVEKASRQTPSVTASNGGALPTSRGSAINFDKMSDAELAEFLKSN